MAQMCMITKVTPPQAGDVFLNEIHAQVNLRCDDDGLDNTWYLDTGATNHMTGSKASFAKLDDTIKGSVKFGDESTVDICGRGVVTFTCHNGEHCQLIDVYYIQ